MNPYPADWNLMQPQTPPPPKRPTIMQPAPSTSLLPRDRDQSRRPSKGPTTVPREPPRYGAWLQHPHRSEKTTRADPLCKGTRRPTPLPATTRLCQATLSAGGGGGGYLGRGSGWRLGFPPPITPRGQEELDLTKPPKRGYTCTHLILLQLYHHPECKIHG
jgi:hypothetical protein